MYLYMFTCVKDTKPASQCRETTDLVYGSFAVNSCKPCLNCGMHDVDDCFEINRNLVQQHSLTRENMLFVHAPP